MNYNQCYVDASLPHRAAILQLGYKWRNNPPYLKGSCRWTYNIQLIISEQPTVHSYLAWENCDGCQHTRDYSTLYRVSIIQHGKRMRRLILSSVTCQTVPYLSTLTHKQDDFW